MEIKDYQKIIEQTAVYPTTVHNFGLAYAWLGLIDETDEFLNSLSEEDEDASIKEMGDVIWYITAICKECDIELESIMELVEDEAFYMSIDEEITPIPGYTGKIKKHYRDKKVIDIEELTEVLAHHILTLENQFEGVYDDVFDYSDVLNRNYDKLIARRATNTLHGDGDNRELEA